MKAHLLLTLAILSSVSIGVEAAPRSGERCKATVYTVSFKSGESSGTISSGTAESLRQQIHSICGRSGCDSVGEVLTISVPGYYDSHGVCHANAGAGTFL